MKQLVKKLTVSTLLLAMAGSVLAAEPPVIPMESAAPKVPTDLITKARLAAENAKPAATVQGDVQGKVTESVTETNAEKESVSSVPGSYKPFEITVDPGINQLIPISVGHYNRIVTPFDQPFINTVSDATIEVHQNVIYVATPDEFPVTLFVSPDIDDESMAISLTLAPKKIPPVEAQLKLREGVEASLPTRTKAKKWEESQPYVDGIIEVMRSVAFGDMPEGYAMGDWTDKDPYPTCLQKGIKYNFLKGQVLRGHNYTVLVGVAQNATNVVQEINEFACVDGSIVASAAWPDAFLEPGQKTEMYVMMKKEAKPIQSRVRKSLLD